jgi:Zn-dependent metalloprotease
MRNRFSTPDSETAAKRHLDQALASETANLKRFVRPTVDAEESDFKSLGTKAMPLTGTTIVKFRQMLNKIPVYGSLVTVELDPRNECLGINSSLARTSSFSDSRRAVLQAARTLFRNEASAARDAKLGAIERGFTAAGIV